MEVPVLGKLIRGITSNVNQYLEEKMAPHGIGHGQFDYFILIASNEGINQNELAKIKSVGKASVTKAIKILVQSGFIERLIDGNDKRNYKLYCTVKGKSIVEGFNDYKTVVEETVLDGMSSDDIQQIYKYLDHIHRNSSKLINKI